MYKERRKYKRFKAIMTVFYRVLGASPREVVSRLIEISKEGLRISDEQEIRAGAAVELNIIVPGNPAPIIALARSVWCEKTDDFYYSKGMQIVKINSQDRDRLLNYAISRSS